MTKKTVKSTAKKVVAAAKKTVKKVVAKATGVKPRTRKPKVVVAPVAVQKEGAKRGEPTKPVYFEGKPVVKVLSSGETKKQYLCEVMDGKTIVTMHVPKELFA